jgi:hypothetical protein
VARKCRLTQATNRARILPGNGLEWELNHERASVLD